MFTTNTLTRSTLFAACALALAAVLCTPAMANDDFDAVMKDAVARNDTQILPEQYKGGSSFTRHIGSEYRGVETDVGAFRSTMHDAVARNDSQLLPEEYVGGGSFVARGGSGMSSDTAFRNTMQDALSRNDSQLLPDQYTGGASFLR